ncbi:MAG: HEPN domain-containing protein [Mariprofundaceae bacterium]
MDDVDSVSIKQWLIKARNDLDSATVLINRELNDTGVYHCQQAAEKMLKAYLSWRKVPLIKVHDLTALVKECFIWDESFEQLMDLADILTPYATAFRYPGDILEPSAVDAEEALQLSEKILEFVLYKLPEDLRGKAS